MGDVVNVYVVLEIGPGAEDEGGLAKADERVDYGDDGGVGGADDGGGAKGTLGRGVSLRFIGVGGLNEGREGAG